MDFEIFKPTKSKFNQRSIDFLTKPVGSLGNRKSPHKPSSKKQEKYRLSNKTCRKSRNPPNQPGFFHP